MRDSLILIGASVRSAAFSALRAGLRPWCADLFGDLDLRQRCPSVVVPAQRYPEGFVDLLAAAPPGPFLYTGALENAPALLARLARERPLWGNDPAILSKVRSPVFVQGVLRDAGLATPMVRPASDPPPERGNWLLKPYSGAGGAGIRFWNREPLSKRIQESNYLQEFLEGPSGSALFIGPRLLGVTRQLTGASWLHALPFRYCGSVGPWIVDSAALKTLEMIGQTLVQASGLRGLFGIDFILREEVPWLVEVNPRYTASVEVLEYATGVCSLALHRIVFDATPPAPESLPTGAARAGLVAKAIYFAPRRLTVPALGPWTADLRYPLPIEAMQAFADIPPGGQVIEAGRPVLTCFSRGREEAECVEKLQHIAAHLDRHFAAG